MSDFIAQIQIFIEQKPGYGEDCKPLCRVSDDKTGLLAVFDGAGGAGGTSYSDAEGNSFTGAFLASRLGKKTLVDFFDELKQTRQSFIFEATLPQLEARLKKVFKDRSAALETASGSKIKSSLIRRLPTTAAAVYYEISASNVTANVFWAGDSRAFLLDAALGLHQLTTDDLKAGGDALANLIEDSPMSNFINADVDFKLHSRRLEIQLPVVLLAATDGCFNFVASPAHFEFLLLKTLHLAENAEGWQTALNEEIGKIAGDDATMSLAALGWQDFGEIKRAFHARLHEIQKTFIAPLDQIIQEIDWLQNRLQTQETERKRLREELWRAYKPNYEQFLIDAGEERK